MVVNNAITAAFGRNGHMRYKYMQEDADLLLEKMICEFPLNRETDAPLPEWAVSLMLCPYIGYRARIMIILSHHEDITGTTIRTHLHFKEKRVSRATKALRESMNITKREIRNG